jgi:2-oxoglutarate ferredoxin oxidoreductase subunit beta
MTPTNTVEQAQPFQYRSSYKPTWCAGCGDYSVLASLNRALTEIGRPPWEVVVVSGIGCSSRFPYFMDTYGFHSAHGRALAVATGIKSARPDLLVVATGGDGDALAIGGNHFFHTMRRNVDITYLLMDNQIYGMTKGQTAPTSGRGVRTKSTPYGVVEPSVDPAWAALTMGATYVAQGASFDVKGLHSLILEGIRHPGMAVINILSPCTTYNREYGKDYFKEFSYDIPEEYDSTDFLSGVQLLREGIEQGRYPLGLIYQKRDQTFDEGIEEVHNAAMRGGRKATLEEIAAHFL